MSHPITTRSIAAATGFGQSTVSMALRGDPRIPEATRLTIRKAADKLGYVPDARLSELMNGVRRRKVTRALQPLAYTLLWPSSDIPYKYKSYREYREGAQERAAEFGYTFEDFVVDEKALSPQRLAQILRTRAVPGMLVAPVSLPYEDPAFHGLDVQLSCHDQALSTIGYSLASPRVNRVTHDHCLASETSVARLSERGYQRIALVSSHAVHVRVQGRWLAGFLLAQQLLAPKERIPPLIMEHIRDTKTFDQWMTRHKPDVILTVEFDEVQDHLQRLHLKTPKDLGLVHLDAASSEKPCAGIDQCNRDIGAVAFDLLLAQILRNERGIPSLRRTVLLEGRWQEGPTLRPS